MSTAVSAQGGSSNALEQRDSAVETRQSFRPTEVDRTDAQTVIEPADAEVPASGAISRVVVRCDIPLCEDPASQRKLVRLTRLAPGAPWEPDAARAAAHLLAELGAFEEITWSAEPEEDGVLVRFDASPVTIVRRVEVDAGRALTDEIRQRIFLRSGQIWRDDEEIIERQKREIIDYFEGDGFFGTTVEIDPIPVAPYEVDLAFHVDRGRRLRVGTVFVRGNDAIPYDEIESTVLASFNLFQEFTQRDFRRAGDAVLREYRRRGYIGARFVFREGRVLEERGRVDLYLELEEGALWRIEFNGNQSIDDNRLREALPFIASGHVDEAEIRRAIQALERTYETTGRYFAEIRATDWREPNGTRRLAFEIDEGSILEVRSIEFQGNHFLSAGELRSVVQTTEYNVLTTSGYLQRTMLANDFRKIEDLYRRRGFLAAKVHRFVVMASEDDRDAWLTIVVDEGLQTRVSDLRFEGNVVLSERELARRIALREGTPFDGERLRADQSEILSRYFDRGYANAAVESACATGAGEPVACDPPIYPPACRLSFESSRRDACDRTRRDGMIIEECQLLRAAPGCAPRNGITSEQVVVRHVVEEGERAVFGDFFVRGNFITRTDAVERELPFQPSEPFDYRLLLAGQSNIRSLGLFNSVRVRSIGLDEPTQERADSHRASVVVEVEEKRRQSAEYEVGALTRATAGDSLQWLATQEAEYVNANYRGRADEVRIAAGLALDAVDFRRIADGELFGTVAARYFDPRFYLWGALDDPWEGRADIGYVYDLLSTIKLRESFARSRVREQFERVPGLAFAVGLEVARTETCCEGGVETFDTALILSVEPTVTLDKRDNPLNPSNGFRVELAVQIAEDFLGVLLDTEQFTKVTTSGQYYLELIDRLVLATNARFGFAVGSVTQGFRTEDGFVLPLSRRFTLGGVSSLRGFAQDEIIAAGARFDEIGGDVTLNGNVELRYPFLPSQDLHGALFVDGGGLAQDFDDFERAAFRASTGLGLRWLIAGQIPLVLDYGVILARRPGEPFGRLNFNIGYTF